MKNVVVFCGSSSGYEKIYEEVARELGAVLAKKGIGLVYGGAGIGLMGAVANGALDHGGHVVGVIPKFLSSKEIAHPNLSELILVDTMHQRKTILNDRSDGAIALPGGFGTMEEFFELLTWGQLGLHQKPIALLNVEGFYDPLIELFESMTRKGFLKEINKNMVVTSDHISNLIELMQSYKPPETGKWITTETT